MIELDWTRRVVSSVECIEQTRWMINALEQILSAHEVCRAVTPPPLSAVAVAAAIARDALGRAIRTRLITCICNCSNVTRRVINRTTNPSTGPTDRSNSKVPYYARLSPQQSMIFLSGDAETAEHPEKRVVRGNFQPSSEELYLLFPERGKGKKDNKFPDIYKDQWKIAL